jgi:hypothetical protein
MAGGGHKGYAPLMASKYLARVSKSRQREWLERGRILFRVLVEFLRLLLQLFEASVGINVDGIFCDFALEHELALWEAGRARIGAAACVRCCGERTILNLCLKVWGA